MTTIREMCRAKVCTSYDTQCRWGYCPACCAKEHKESHPPVPDRGDFRPLPPILYGESNLCL